MQRRQVLQSMMALSASSLLLDYPFNALASDANKTPAINYHALFNSAIIQNPQLLGFADVKGDFLPQQLNIEGKIPNDLQGIFYRNGPAKHERDGIRYQHLFEGDGMLQSFNFIDGKIIHQGKFINTPKYQQEQQAQKFVYSGPETKIANTLPVSSVNTINTANTNIIAVGDDLWALWEAGSPTKINRESLAYEGLVSLGAQSEHGSSLNGLPFSAHPKIEANGDMWNFGLSPSGHIVLYHLNAHGQVKNVNMINAQYRGGMLHDFLITDKHLLIILPSLTTDNSVSNGYFSRVTFSSKQAMRVMKISKVDLTVKKQYELPAGFAFHYGNAWEDKDGTIRFDASLYPNVDALYKLSRLMKGDTQQADVNAKMAFFTLNTDGSAQQNLLNITSEFPKICDHLVGIKNNFLYHLSSQTDSIWSDTVSALNINTGKEDSYPFGEDFLVEEHISVCANNKEGHGYLIGTALHIPSKRTCLNIFKANNIADGPVARAWLNYHLPLGFHGSFIAA